MVKLSRVCLIFIIAFILIFLFLADALAQEPDRLILGKPTLSSDKGGTKIKIPFDPLCDPADAYSSQMITPSHICDLSAEDITLFENGEEPVEEFELIVGSKPLFVYLVIDNSGSSGSWLPKAKEIIRAFFNAEDGILMETPQPDIICPAYFVENGPILLEPTYDHNKICNDLRGITNEHNFKTRLVDLLKQAVEHWAVSKDSADRRGVVLVFSDGIDTTSGHSLNTVIEEAEEAGISIYTIGLGPNLSVESEASALLRRLAQETGGGYLWLPPAASANDPALIEFLKRMATHKHYTIQFVSQLCQGEPEICLDINGHQECIRYKPLPVDPIIEISYQAEDDTHPQLWPPTETVGFDNRGQITVQAHVLCKQQPIDKFEFIVNGQITQRAPNSIITLELADFVQFDTQAPFDLQVRLYDEYGQLLGEADRTGRVAPLQRPTGDIGTDKEGLDDYKVAGTIVLTPGAYPIIQLEYWLAETLVSTDILDPRQRIAKFSFDVRQYAGQTVPFEIRAVDEAGHEHLLASRVVTLSPVPLPSQREQTLAWLQENGVLLLIGLLALVLLIMLLQNRLTGRGFFLGTLTYLQETIVRTITVLRGNKERDVVARLVQKDKKDNVFLITSQCDQLRVGRDKKLNHFTVVGDQEVSREHLKIMRNGENFYALDIGSANGSSVDGKPLPPVKPEIRDLEQGIVLKHGSEILLGSKTTLIFWWREEEEEEEEEKGDEGAEAESPPEEIPDRPPPAKNQKPSFSEEITQIPDDQHNPTDLLI